MKYIVLLVWSAILFSVLSYVVSAINGADFGMADVKQSLIYSLGFSVAVLVLSALIPNESPKEVGTHQN